MFFKIVIIFTICFLKIYFCKLTAVNENIYDDDEIEMITIEPRIVGGYRPNDPILAKYIVSLRYRSEAENRFGYTHFCAGTIVASNKIVTAAHCVYRDGKKNSATLYKIVASTPVRLSRTTNTQEINVKKVILHPNYSDSTLFHDIALLILQSDILLDSKFAAKISLPKNNIEPGRVCTVIGWGRLYMHGPLANEILFVDLHLHSRKQCRKRFPNFSGKKICASNIYDRGKDACVGDSGGPLICSGVFTGIVSYGYGCAMGNAGVYTNVYKYVDWINSNGQLTLKPTLFIIVLNFLLVV